LPVLCVLQVLEFIVTRESGAVFEAGGLNAVLSFIAENGTKVHKDTLHSSMSVSFHFTSRLYLCIYILSLYILYTLPILPLHYL